MFFVKGIALPPSFFKTNPLNFTSGARTPWGGTAIARIKARNLRERSVPFPQRIGESWEVSTSEPLPSSVHWQGLEVSLSDLLMKFADHFMNSEERVFFGTQVPILLKWLEAAETLSVQVHPRQNHPALKVNEGGKTEAWMVVATEPGSHLYLGFSSGADRDQIETLMRRGELASVLHRVEPRVGDFIVIPPGCVHALGPGVLVVEPQVVLPGREGLTWRLFDWNRRYDSSGLCSPLGSPRELHLEKGLSAIDWDLPQGSDLESRLRFVLSDGTPFLGGEVSPFLALHLSGEGCHQIPAALGGRLVVISAIEGRVECRLSDSGPRLELRGGESAIIAAGVALQEVVLNPGEGVPAACSLFALRNGFSTWLS